MASPGFGGLQAMIGKLGQVHTQVREGGQEGLYAAGRNVLNVSNTMVPIEEHDLEADGKVGVEGMRVGIGYGSDPEVAEYAVTQHERMDYQHDSGRQAKFLEQALAQTRDQNLAIIQQAVRSKMGG